MDTIRHRTTRNSTSRLFGNAESVLVHFLLQALFRIYFAGAAVGFWLALLGGVLPLEVARRLGGSAGAGGG